MKFFSCLRTPVDRNTLPPAIGLFGKVTMGSSIFYLTKCFRCILYSILLLLLIFFLLFTVHFYHKDLGMIAFPSLYVNSLNIKGRFFSKFSIKYCTCLHACIFFFSLLFFISVISVLLSGDIETYPSPDPRYSNSCSFSHWNLNRIAAHNFIKMSLL